MKTSVWLPLVGAITWAALLIPGAVYVPIGSQQYTGPDQDFTPNVRSTLVQLNGHGILILVALPLVLSCLAGVFLVVRSPVAQWAAWVCTGAVLAGAVLGTVTFLIGIFVMPGGALLSVACTNLHAHTFGRDGGLRTQPPGE